MVDPQIPGRVTPEQAVALIRDYRGELASPEDLKLVKELVRSVVIDRRTVLQHTLSTLSGFAYWCKQQALPVTEQTVLGPAVIGRYVVQGAEPRPGRPGQLLPLAPPSRAGPPGRLFSDHRKVQLRRYENLVLPLAEASGPAAVC